DHNWWGLTRISLTGHPWVRFSFLSLYDSFEGETVKTRSPFSLLLLTLAAGLGSLVVVSHLHAQQNNRVAFTASVRETLYSYPAGKQAAVKDTVFAFAETGKRVEIRQVTNPAGQSAEQRIVTDPNAHTRIVADGLTQLLTTTHMNHQNAARYTAKPSKCTGDAVPEHLSLLGYDVVKSVVLRTTQSGSTWKTESWNAPALDCFPLREIVTIQKAAQPAVVTNVREATNVVLGTPPASSFEIPAGYVERPPSGVMAEFSRRYPDHPTSLTGLDQSDVAYYKQQ
ncbi:MAG TPA: hypothetical protein VG675_19255, partial [Bryobacteraceae bacterium]|nr:hypothetical protein [Bryobacteraceae bacterium]